MNVARIVAARWNPEHLRLCSHHGVSSLDRFLHDIAKGASFDNAALSPCRGDFDCEQLAAHGCPGKARDLTHLVLLLSSAKVELPHAEHVCQHVWCNGLTGLSLTQSKGFHHLSAHLGDLSLQRSDTRLTGVVTDNIQTGLRRDINLVWLQPIELGLLGYEVLLSDIQFFVFGIAGDSNHFHSIQQRSGDIHGVGGADEHHIREIVVHLEVMVVKGMILFRIQHLKHRGSGITAMIHTHLVDLVEQEQRIPDTCLGHLL